jgi:hypothetical protein
MSDSNLQPCICLRQNYKQFDQQSRSRFEKSIIIFLGFIEETEQVVNLKPVFH